MQQEARQFEVHSPVLETFIGEAERVAAAEPDRARAVDLLRPAFSRLLADQTWLPERFTQPDAEGGMGGGIGNYLLFRSAQRDLTLMSLVLPAGSSTPVHDHLAWGLVGLYRGEQDERVYRRTSGGDAEGRAVLIEEER